MSVKRLLCCVRLELLALRRQFVPERLCRGTRSEYRRATEPLSGLSTVFHFTSGVACKGILLEGFRESRRGWLGPGVYAGTLPNPPGWLKLWLWGQFNRPVRVPVKRLRNADFSKVSGAFPPYTVVVRKSEWPRHPLFHPCPKDLLADVQAAPTYS